MSDRQAGAEPDSTSERVVGAEPNASSGRTNGADLLAHIDKALAEGRKPCKCETVNTNIVVTLPALKDQHYSYSQWITNELSHMYTEFTAYGDRQLNAKIDPVSHREGYEGELDFERCVEDLTTEKPRTTPLTFATLEKALIEFGQWLKSGRWWPR